MDKPLGVRSFAELAGVTVRALHHYDRLTLLRPRRTEAGYRIYSVCDLERLEQIVALKFLGIPLKRIRDLLEKDKRDLSGVLRAQRRALEEKRRLLDRAIGAIRLAEQQPGAAAFKHIIEVMEMQDHASFLNRYYTEEAQAKLAERQPQWSPELQDRISKAWTDLFRDVESSLGEDPAGEKAQALAARWKDLTAQFTGGDPATGSGVSKAWAGREQWPQDLQQKAMPFSDPKVWEFIGKAMNAHKA